MSNVPRLARPPPATKTERWETPPNRSVLNEDPIKMVQIMIHDSHYSLTCELEKLMIEHEHKLRLQIKLVLRAHAGGASLQAARRRPVGNPSC